MLHFIGAKSFYFLGTWYHRPKLSAKFSYLILTLCHNKICKSSYIIQNYTKVSVTKIDIFVTFCCLGLLFISYISVTNLYGHLHILFHRTRKTWRKLQGKVEGGEERGLISGCSLWRLKLDFLDCRPSGHFWLIVLLANCSSSF